MIELVVLLLRCSLGCWLVGWLVGVILGKRSTVFYPMRGLCMWRFVGVGETVLRVNHHIDGQWLWGERHTEAS